MWQLIPMAIGAALSAQQASEKRDQQRRFNVAQSEVTRYSPWTGMKGQMDGSYSPSTLSAGVAGGLQGLSMAQSMNGAFGASQDPTAGMTGEQKGIYQGIAPQKSFFGQSPQTQQQPSNFYNNNFNPYSQA